jgi:VanZ family protein
LSDKAAHLLAYAALGASLLRALASGRSAGMTVRRMVAAAVLATLYGVSDELHQSFVPGRHPELMDLVADGIGGATGAVVLAAFARALNRLLRPQTPA